MCPWNLLVCIGDTFRQQNMVAWQPIMTPLKIIVVFLIAGVCFIPTGTSVWQASNGVFEKVVYYDNGGGESGNQCSISKQNQRRRCPITFTIDQDVKGPLLVYYQLDNFNQNHRIYVNSRSVNQLLGQNMGLSDLGTQCSPLTTNGSLILNPCGLIANSFFTDTYTLSYSGNNIANLNMDETDISWPTDRSYKFKQVEGFQYAAVPSSNTTCASVKISSPCKYYRDKAGQGYLFYYPNDANVQYLYETYPQHISPLKGVSDEHFIVWMRVAALPNFRKLYGRINGDFKSGDTISFTVTANFEVRSFGGAKSLVITTASQFGGKNPGLGLAFIVVGSLSMFLGLVFILKQLIVPRSLGDPKLLDWER